MTLRLLYFFLFCFFTITLPAQIINEKEFIRYTTKDGLSSNFAEEVTQDIYGYIWIATNKGLNRFDGATFQKFYSDSGRNSLPADFIHRLKWLDKEQLAVFTINGLHIINVRTLQQRNLVIPPDSLQSLSSVNRVMDAFANKKGDIFIATATGFYQLNSKGELVFRYDHFSRKHIEEKKPVAFGMDIIPLEDNILFISGFKGPYLFYIDKKDFHAVNNTDPDFYQQIGVPGKQVIIPHSDATSFTSLEKDNDKLSWFDTRRKSKHPIEAPFKISEKINPGSARLSRINDTLFVINSVLGGCYFGHFDQRKNSYELWPEAYFKNIYCNSFLIDKNHGLWIATNLGLFREKKSLSVVEQITMPPGLSDPQHEIQSLAVSNNRIFAGTYKQGLFILDADSLKHLGRLNFETYRKDLPFANYVFQLLPVNNDTLYAAIAGMWINSRNLTMGIIPLSQVDTNYKALDLLFKDSRNNIYLKSGERNIFYHQKPYDISFAVIDYRSELARLGFDAKGMAEDPEGNLWFTGSGMTRFNTKTQAFDLYIDSFPAIKTPRKSITTNLVFDKSAIYFGVYANGLIIYDQLQKKFAQITRTDGLPDNTITALVLHKTKLWMITESGLACYDLSTKKISSFGAADGIPFDNGHIYSLYYDSTRHHLYGAFKNTIFRFDPDKLAKNNIPPAFDIESMVIAGKETIYHPENQIKLSYKQNNIVINLAAVNFDDANLQEFAYRLVEKGNEPWFPLGSQRSIIFSNLSPGTHKLQVKVFIRNQSWPDQIKEITITIAPPFWKTIWFYLIITFFISAIIYSLHRRRINKVTQRANIDRLLAQTELKALHAQMNPHFIFNCLNSIREMILQNENQQASHYLSKFAQLIRSTLNQSSKPFVSLATTIDYLKRYADMEKIRNNRFNYTIEVDDLLQTDEVMIPPMLIQPFLENAIWHGAIPGKNLQIRIRFKKDDNRLVCFVEDNGQGIETSMNTKKELQADHNSIGIANVRERLQVLNEKYKLNSELSIEDKSKCGHETGTIVKLYFPLQSLAS